MMNNNDTELELDWSKILHGEKVPYPFQKGGVVEILTRPHILLADEMGLGKTAQVLWALNYARPSKVLVIAPRVALTVWQREAEDILLPEYLQSFTEEDEFEVSSMEVCTGARFTIINYEALNKWVKTLCRIDWDWIVIDEVHYIKSANAFRSTSVRAVCERGKKIIEISGSPIMNYVYELYPILLPLIKAYDKTTAGVTGNRSSDSSISSSSYKGNDLVGARHYSNFAKIWPEASNLSSFMSRYTWGKGNKNVRRADELQSKLRETFMIRRLKKEVLVDLPRKRRQIIEFKVEDAETLKLLEYEKKLFEGRSRSVDDILEDIVMEANSAGVSISDIAESEIDWDKLVEGLKFNKQVFFEEMSRVRHETALRKLPYALEHIEGVFDALNGEGKLVVFAHHRDVCKMIAEHFNALNIKSTTVIGADPHRDEKVDAFQNGDLRLFVGSIKAVGIALTLTRASHCIFVEIDWSPPIITQAEDRIHRIGSEIHDSILIQHLVLENSLDAFISKKVVSKQRQIEQVLTRRGA